MDVTTLLPALVHDPQADGYRLDAEIELRERLEARADSLSKSLRAEHLTRLNSFDLITPDGQPVRWAMNWLHDAGLPDRVYACTNR